MVVTFSHAGYAKYQPIDVYRSQRRGGRGKTATNVREEDFVDTQRAHRADPVDVGVEERLAVGEHGVVHWMPVCAEFGGDIADLTTVARPGPSTGQTPLIREAPRTIEATLNR